MGQIYSTRGSFYNHYINITFYIDKNINLEGMRETLMYNSSCCLGKYLSTSNEIQVSSQITDTSWQVQIRWLHNQAGRLEVDVTVETRHINHLLRQVDKQKASMRHVALYMQAANMGDSIWIIRKMTILLKYLTWYMFMDSIHVSVSLKQRQTRCHSLAEKWKSIRRAFVQVSQQAEQREWLVNTTN